MIDERRRIDEARRQLELEQEKKMRLDQQVILNKGRVRPKLSFSLKPTVWGGTDAFPVCACCSLPAPCCGVVEHVITLGRSRSHLELFVWTLALNCAQVEHAFCSLPCVVNVSCAVTGQCYKSWLPLSATVAVCYPNDDTREWCSCQMVVPYYFFFFRRVKYLGELKLLLSAVIRHDRQAAALHCRIDANIA